MANKCFAHSVLAASKATQDRNWNNHMKSLVKSIKRKMLEAAKKYGGSSIRIETNNHYLLRNGSDVEDVAKFKNVLNNKLGALGLYAPSVEMNSRQKADTLEEFIAIEVTIPHHVASAWEIYG